MTSKTIGKRAERVRQLYNCVAMCGDRLSETRLVARYAIDNEISTTTAKQYANELLSDGVIFRRDGHLTI